MVTTTCKLPQRVAPTAQVMLYRNLGMVFMRQWTTTEGQICRSCASKYATAVRKREATSDALERDFRSQFEAAWRELKTAAWSDHPESMDSSALAARAFMQSAVKPPSGAEILDEGDEDAPVNQVATVKEQPKAVKGQAKAQALRGV